MYNIEKANEEVEKNNWKKADDFKKTALTDFGNLTRITYNESREIFSLGEINFEITDKK